MKRARAASLWSSLTAGFLILIVLLIFITPNTTSAQFAFLHWRIDLPLGVAILLAAVGGGLLTVLVGTARIFPVRKASENLAAGGWDCTAQSIQPQSAQALCNSVSPRAISGATVSPRPGPISSTSSAPPDILLRKSMPAAMMASSRSSASAM